MHAFPILMAVLCVLAIAYRYYSAFLAAKVCVLDDRRVTPAHRLADGQNFHPTPKWVLFGHHFAAISGAGPLIGPVLAAQYGYLPGLLWIVVGVTLAGAVQDFTVLVGSVRRDGQSLVKMIHAELGPVAGIAGAVVVLFVLIIALAGLGIVVVNALSESAWGTFTLVMTIPIALAMGWYDHRIRPGRIVEASVFGLLALLAALILGRGIAHGPWGSCFTVTRNQVTAGMAVYGFVASVLPVWLLLCPRDYLSSFLKIGTIAALVAGVLIVNPPMRIPPLTPFIHGGGPIIGGKVLPFLFLTIMCGSISGFHALVASGTTPKMVGRESDCRTIGYGCMLIEGLVGVVALIAVSNIAPGDYFAINVPPAQFESLKIAGYSIEELPVFEAQVEEKIAGRTGGAVSLAVGMANIFSRLPGLKGWMSYWYHFAILFEALFILTTIDAGTRIARFVMGELLGNVWVSFRRTDWLPGSVLTSLLTVAGWTYFIYTGSVATIWPMFGVANQLLAVVALAVCTCLVLGWQKRYVWVTGAPLLVVLATTSWGAIDLVWQQFLPWTHAASGGDRWRGWLDIAMTGLMLACLCVILAATARAWIRNRATARPQAGADPRGSGLLGLTGRGPAAPGDSK